jgi:hypothetical protein
MSREQRGAPSLSALTQRERIFFAMASSKSDTSGAAVFEPRDNVEQQDEERVA